jgi:hypothetical protein
MRHHARVTRHHAIHHRARSAHSPLVGVGNAPGCVAGATRGLGVLGRYHAQVLRLIIDPRHGANGEALACVRSAAARGIRVHIAVQYDNRWSTARDVAYFARILSFYGPYAWAVSVGNEQELAQGGITQSAARYASVWRAVAPVLRRAAPHAIRVAGEVSPWGLSFLRAAFASGLPGAQAISVHAYRSHWGFDLPSVVAWARGTHLPLWVTEGLAGPGAWPNGYRGMYAVPLSAMKGVAVADVWLS